MKITRYFCDICKQEVEENRRYSFRYYPPYNVYAPQDLELCIDCYYEIWETVHEKIKELQRRFGKKA